MAKRKKKNRVLPPRRLRMKRAQRLQAASKWLSSYGGKNLVRGYARWFGVNHLCALKELQMLGIQTDPVYAQQLHQTEEGKAQRTAARKLEKAQERAEWDRELIAFLQTAGGTTSGGVPIGLSPEEIAEVLSS